MSRRYHAVKIRPMRKLALIFRRVGILLTHYLFRSVYGMDIHPTCRFSLKANLDRTNPKGVHIGAETYVAFGAVVLAHDMSRGFHADTYIGSRCFIGAHSIILPGVRVGDSCIIGAGAVVTKDIPSGSIAVGNPARIIKEGIETTSMGKLVEKS